MCLRPGTPFELCPPSLSPCSTLRSTLIRVSFGLGLASHDLGPEFDFDRSHEVCGLGCMSFPASHSLLLQEGQGERQAGIDHVSNILQNHADNHLV